MKRTVAFHLIFYFLTTLPFLVYRLYKLAKTHKKVDMYCMRGKSREKQLPIWRMTLLKKSWKVSAVSITFSYKVGSLSDLCRLLTHMWDQAIIADHFKFFSSFFSQQAFLPSLFHR